VENRPRTLGPAAAELVPSSVLAPAPYSAYGDEGFTSGGPLAYWRVFLRRRWTVILSAITGLGAGLLTTLLQPRIYEARASLELQDLNENFLNMKQVLPINETGLSGALSDLQTQIKILQSDSVLDAVIAKMPSLEAQPPQDVNSAPSKARKLLGSPSSEFLEVETKRLADTLKVRAIGQTRVIELTADSRSARFAADFLNQLCTEYIDQNMKARWEMGQRTSQSLARMLEESRVKLRESEDALQRYAKTSGLMFTSEKKNVAEEKLSQLQDELSKAEASRIAAQARYDMAKTSSRDGLPDELSQGSVREYQAKLAELRRQRAELGTTYTSDYNKVKRLDAQIASLEDAIRVEERDVVRRIENEYQEAAGRESLLASSYARQSAVVSDLAERAIQYNILEQELDGNRQLYDEMLKQVKEATVASAIRASNARVLDQALPPKQTHSPKPVLNCALGILIGLSFGMLFGFARDRADSSLREPGEGQKYLGVAELGAMLHDGDGGGLLRSVEQKSLAGAVNPQDIPGATESRKSRMSEQLRSLERLWPRLCGPEASPVLAMESCRAVVTSLLCGSNGTMPRLLVVTSAGPGEGKTTVLANLGVMLAVIGRRVLLVDGDVRRHRLHELFGLHNDRGLSTLLQAEARVDGPLDAFVQRTCVPYLSLLASGPSSACANSLHSPHFSQLLRRLRQRYEFVLIDTPPVLQIPDARVIGQLADGVILVVRAGHTSREAAVAAHQRLVADGTRILGMILNDWDPKLSRHGYYADYTREYAGTSGR
jgi:polysaccharide biosynthesis transport protein